MRRILAALLLTVQLQPLAGSVLCLASVHPAREMQQMAGMPGMDEGAPPSRPAGTVVLDVAGASVTTPGCPFVQACAPLVLAVLSTSAPRSTPAATHTVAIRAAGPVLALEGRAPPTPPPNL